MLLIHRILVYTSNSYELLFDLDFSNAYSKDEIKAVIKTAKHDLPPVHVLRSVNLPRTICRLKIDQTFITLLAEKSELSSLEKGSLLKLAREYAALCQTFLGSLNQQNVLANVARLAELTDQVFIAGRIHLLTADRIRGFITTPYIEPNTLNVPGMPSQFLSTARLTAPQLSRSSHTHQNKVLASHSQTPNNSVGNKPTTKAIPQGSTATMGSDLYVDLIENVTLISNSSGEPVLNIQGSLNTNNNSISPINVHFKFKNMDQLGNALTFHKTADGSKFQTDQELIVNGTPVGQASLLTYSKKISLKDERPLFTIQAVHIKNSDNPGLKFLLQCNAPHGSISMKTSVNFKLPAAFNTNKGAVSTLRKLPSHALHLRPSGKDELLKPNERELDSFHSDVDLIWSIPEIHGQVAVELVVQFLPGRRKHDTATENDIVKLDKLDAQMTFEISNFLASGAKLTGVRIDKHMSSGVKKWVRQLTASGTVYELACIIHE